jgi:hypothetical protein
MSMWTAIALITIAAIAGEAYRNKVKGGRSRAQAEEIEALQKKVDQLDSDLRERVETLERIVTDRSENLRRQFDHLDKVG